MANRIVEQTERINIVGFSKPVITHFDDYDVLTHETYIFYFHNERYKELLDTFDRYATNPKLSFDWKDVGNLRESVYRLIKQ